MMGYKWNNDRILLSSLTKACKIKNDILKLRMPIHKNLLEMILFEIQRLFRRKKQPFLEVMYKALFILGYYSLMRIGELTSSPHVVKAKDVHMAKNKQKLLQEPKQEKVATKRQQDPMFNFFIRRKQQDEHDKFRWFKSSHRTEDARRVIDKQQGRFLLPRIQHRTR